MKGPDAKLDLTSRTCTIRIFVQNEKKTVFLFFRHTRTRWSYGLRTTITLRSMHGITTRPVSSCHEQSLNMSICATKKIWEALVPAMKAVPLPPLGDFMQFTMNYCLRCCLHSCILCLWAPSSQGAKQTTQSPWQQIGDLFVCSSGLGTPSLDENSPNWGTFARDASKKSSRLGASTGQQKLLPW